MRRVGGDPAESDLAYWRRGLAWAQPNRGQHVDFLHRYQKPFSNSWIGTNESDAQHLDSTTQEQWGLRSHVDNQNLINLSTTIAKQSYSLTSQISSPNQPTWVHAWFIQAGINFRALWRVSWEVPSTHLEVSASSAPQHFRLQHARLKRSTSSIQKLTPKLQGKKIG